MHADTDAVRALGHSHSAHADDLASVASALTALPIEPDALGAVGSRFVAALSEALATASGCAAALADRAAAGAATASGAAAAYDGAGRRAAALIRS